MRNDNVGLRQERGELLREAKKLHPEAGYRPPIRRNSLT